MKEIIGYSHNVDIIFKDITAKMIFHKNQTQVKVENNLLVTQFIDPHTKTTYTHMYNIDSINKIAVISTPIEIFKPAEN